MLLSTQAKTFVELYPLIWRRGISLLLSDHQQLRTRDVPTGFLRLVISNLHSTLTTVPSLHAIHPKTYNSAGSAGEALPTLDPDNAPPLCSLKVRLGTPAFRATKPNGRNMRNGWEMLRDVQPLKSFGSKCSSSLRSFWDKTVRPNSLVRHLFDENLCTSN